MNPRGISRQSLDPAALRHHTRPRIARTLKIAAKRVAGKRGLDISAIRRSGSLKNGRGRRRTECSENAATVRSGRTEGSSPVSAACRKRERDSRKCGLAHVGFRRKILRQREWRTAERIERLAGQLSRDRIRPDESRIQLIRFDGSNQFRRALHHGPNATLGFRRAWRVRKAVPQPPFEQARACAECIDGRDGASRLANGRVVFEVAPNPRGPPLSRFGEEPRPTDPPCQRSSEKSRKVLDLAAVEAQSRKSRA